MVFDKIHTLSNMTEKAQLNRSQKGGNGAVVRNLGMRSELPEIAPSDGLRPSRETSEEVQDRAGNISQDRQYFAGGKR